MVRRHERLQERSAQDIVNLSQLHAISLNLATTFSQTGYGLLRFGGQLFCH